MNTRCRKNSISVQILCLENQSKRPTGVHGVEGVGGERRVESKECVMKSVIRGVMKSV